MSISDKSALSKAQSVDIETLERELMLVLNEEAMHSRGDSKQSPINNAVDPSVSKDSDDVLVQLAIESELALNSPKVLQEQKQNQSLSIGMEKDELAHLQELDSLFGSRNATDPRVFSLNQKQEFDSLLSQQVSIDHVIESLSSEVELGDSEYFSIDECDDPLKLIQIGNKPVQHEAGHHNQMPVLTQKSEYQGSLDSVVPSFLSGHEVPDINKSKDPVAKNNEPESLLDGLEESAYDILDLIPPFVKNK
jgi:hypothetical protein